MRKFTETLIDVKCEPDCFQGYGVVKEIIMINISVGLNVVLMLLMFRSFRDTIINLN